MYMHQMGDTTVSVTNAPLSFNSTKVPGVCKPMDFKTLAVFEDLQSQLNRVAHAKGLPKIAVDGDIGTGTTGLMVKVGMASAGITCTAVAVAAGAFAAQAKQLADQLGAPAKVSGPPPIKPPSILDPNTLLEIPAPSGGIAASFANLSTAGKLAAVVALGGIGYFLIGSKKKKSKGRK